MTIFFFRYSFLQVRNDLALDESPDTAESLIGHLTKGVILDNNRHNYCVVLNIKYFPTLIIGVWPHFGSSCTFFSLSDWKARFRQSVLLRWGFLHDAETGFDRKPSRSPTTIPAIGKPSTILIVNLICVKNRVQAANPILLTYLGVDLFASYTTSGHERSLVTQLVHQKLHRRCQAEHWSLEKRSNLHHCSSVW